MNLPKRLRTPPAIGITALLASAVLAAATSCTSRAAGTSPPRHRASATPRSSSASPVRDARTTNLNVYDHTLQGDMSPALAGVPERVYVPNSESASIDVIDPRTFRIVAHYPAGQFPEHITPSWDMRWLYANNTSSNSLTVIDPRTG